MAAVTSVAVWEVSGFLIALGDVESRSLVNTVIQSQIAQTIISDSFCEYQQLLLSIDMTLALAFHDVLNSAASLFL